MANQLETDELQWPSSLQGHLLTASLLGCYFFCTAVQQLTRS